MIGRWRGVFARELGRAAARAIEREKLLLSLFGRYILRYARIDGTSVGGGSKRDTALSRSGDDFRQICRARKTADEQAPPGL